MKKIYSSNTVDAITGMFLFLLWIIGAAVFRWLLPQYYFSSYPFIPILFFVSSIVFLRLLLVWEKKVKKGVLSQRKLTSNLMIFKLVRLAVYAVAMICFVKFDSGGGENSIASLAPFLITFAIFFFVSQFLDAFAMLHFDRRVKSDTEGLDIQNK